MASALNKNSVERTLIIPLWCRALAAKKLPNILPDPYAAKILKKIGETKPPHPLYYMQCASLTGAIRQYDLSVELGDYLKKHPAATVVELGAGLSCLRRQMKNKTNPWINIDLPDVIKLREQYIPTSDNEKNYACDITDLSWFDLIPFDKEKGVIFAAAGLLQYFDYKFVQGMICKMAERFPGGTFVFDITTDKGIRNGNVTVRSTGNATKLTFALNDAPSEMPAWSDRLLNITQKDYYTGYYSSTEKYSWFTKLYIRSKQGQLAIVHVDFRED